MRLITNRIHMSQPTKTVEDLVKEARARNANSQIKTAASAEGLVKTAAAKEQEVKTTAKVAKGDPTFGGKKAPEFGSKGKSEDCDEPKKKGMEKDECDETMAASKEVEIKVAEEKSDKGEKGEETYDAGKKEGTEFVNKDIKEPKEADTKPITGGDKPPKLPTTKTPEGTFPSSGQPQWEGKQENNNKPVEPTDKNTQASVEAAFKAVLAQLAAPFTKTSNLKPAAKKTFKDYWRGLFGEDYADAMAADK